MEVVHPIAFTCSHDPPVPPENGVQQSVPIKVLDVFAPSANSTPRKPNSTFVVCAKIRDMIGLLLWNLMG